MAAWSELLRTARERRARSQEALAARTRLSPKTLYHHESRRLKRPRRTTLLRVTRALGLGHEDTNAILAATVFGLPDRLRHMPVVQPRSETLSS